MRHSAIGARLPGRGNRGKANMRYFASVTRYRNNIGRIRTDMLSKRDVIFFAGKQ